MGELASPLKVVHTTLRHYLEPSKGGSDSYPFACVADKRRKFDEVPVDIHDIRGREHEFTLDVQGFQLFRSATAEKSFDDDARIKDAYYKECIDILKKVTGASRILVHSHLIRRQSFETVLENEKNLRDDEPTTAPANVRFIHVDLSYDGSQRAIQHLLPDEVEKVSQNRWASINVWRPIETVTRDALAVCDARSIPESDLREVTAIVPRSKPEQSNGTTDAHSKAYAKFSKDIKTWNLAAPKTPGQHKWYYASQMQPDEALLLKIFDSKNDGVAKRSPHTSFKADSDYGSARQSIEVRCFCFWEDQAAE